MKKLLLLALLTMMGAWLPVHAAETEKEQPAATEDNYAYYGFEPEIVTNYISNRKKLGFVRISVELMVKNPDDLLEIQHHDPLLRSAIVEILGNQTEDKVKSLTGREEIRKECFDTVNRLLQQETGKELVVNLLFTSYLYD
ncbi:flagellar basal body-associated protein FliL [Shewanella yunxiaonensis]|uniref:Flagellar protein FliL n=1 Tax=Shewanella yunxiaonensis TaxID=2829809 RepID=A0ABX7YSW6_9GAMM|nr:MULTISPECIES: flagellar basal body-associated protein FliL [Shewanella]MDF0533439.1 flagellar basal body-associated protein FliL [Shewanella sp. A32]QUN05817.1 flagellar basal body-associated protein FliL [Shewanella yunxiaonensis]